MKPIPFAKADIVQEDINIVGKVLESGWLTHGQYTESFENKFAEFTGAKHAIAVSNCTAGLHLSCLAIGLGPKDEVIVPAQTHVATAHAVELTGAKAVFADIELWTGNILPKEIENHITKKTKAIIIVHMAGYPCRMNEILEITKKYNLVIIEDCAHAIGTKFNNKHVGNFGITGNFSFYPTKQITTGEGGMVITNDDLIANFIKKHRAFGIDSPPNLRKLPGHYDVIGLGHNYRMTDFQAALGFQQLCRYKQNLNRRRKNAEIYHGMIKEASLDLKYPPLNRDASYFLFQIFTGSTKSRQRLAEELKEKNIGFSIHYARPIPLMTYYRNKYGFDKNDYVNASRYGRLNISLPVHPYLKKVDIERIVDVLKENQSKTDRSK